MGLTLFSQSYARVLEVEQPDAVVGADERLRPLSRGRLPVVEQETGAARQAAAGGPNHVGAQDAQRSPDLGGDDLLLAVAVVLG